MKITWYGTASILLETNDNALLFDPYMKYLPEGAEREDIKFERLSAFKKQKNVLITHGHFDHLSSVKEVFSDVDCKIYLTKTPLKTLKKQGFGQEKLREIKPGEELLFGDIKVRALQGKHVKFRAKDIFSSVFQKSFFKDFNRRMFLNFQYLKYPQNGEILFFEVEAEGKLVQIMGSAGLFEGANYRAGADILILPHQGRGDIDVCNAKTVEILKPKRILLDHYDNAFPPFTSEVNVEEFCKETSKIIPTERLIEGKTVEI